MRKGNILSGRSWHRLVRVLACITVFCTTYALILPAITQEAHAFCGSQEHKHTEKCYEDILTCTKEEHVHDASCQDCQLEEHTHSEDCYRQLLKCEMEEHTHELECFSDPEADVETEADWKKTLPQDTEDLTSREQIVATAESQEGYRESEKNYQVKNETETKGWTRYGSWDGDPYEDWTGAYVRFVLHYSQISTEDAKGLTADWLEQLYKKDALESAENAESGDVLFVYDETDELKAGIVTKTTDTTITALMGDWKDKVAKEAFAIEDEDIHSIWKPVASERKEEMTEEPEPEPEKPVQEEAAQEEPKADMGKPEEKEAEKESAEVSYDYTQQAEAEDGAIIRASWNEGTFETEDVVFQARKVELSEEEQKKIQEHLDQDKDYTFRNYDLSFYVRGEDTELQEIEPNLPVHVEIEFPEENGFNEDKTSIFHFFKDGEIESVEKTKEKTTEMSSDKGIRFKGSSFTVYTLAEEDGNETAAQAAAQPIDVSSWGEINNYCYSSSDHTLGSDEYLRLTQDIAGDYEIGVAKTVQLDLNGHNISCTQGTAFNVTGSLTVFDSTKENITSSIEDGNTQNNESGWDRNNHAIYFNCSNSQRYVIRNLAVIHTQGAGSTIRVSGDGKLNISDCGIIDSQHHAISVEGDTGKQGASLQMSNVYLVRNHSQALFITGKSRVEINGGFIADQSLTPTSYGATSGAAIYAGPSQEDAVGANKTANVDIQITLNGGTQIIYNHINSSSSNIYGGAILLRGATLNVREATISNNSINAGSWGNGGGIAACCSNVNVVNANNAVTEYTWGTPSVVNLYDGAVISNNTAGNGGGGLFIQGPRQNDSTPNKFDQCGKLFMYGGVISGNIAQTNEGGGIHQAATYNSYAYLFKGTIENNQTNTNEHWGGGGAFVGENSYMVLPNGASVSANKAQGLGGGIAACSTGNIIFDEKVVIAQNSSQASSWTGTSTSKPYDREYAQGRPGFQQAGDARDFFSCLYASVSALLPKDLGGANWSGSVDYNLVSNISSGTLTANQLMGLINNAEKEIQDKALTVSPLKIQSNSSNVHGGGILVNGYLIGGNVKFLPAGPTVTFHADKQLLDKDGKVTELGSSVFEFELLDKNTQEVVATGKNDSTGAISFAPPIVYMPTISESDAADDKVITTTASYIMREKQDAGGSFEMSSEEYEISFECSTTLKYVMSYPVYDENGGYTIISVYKADTTIKDNTIRVRKVSSGDTTQFTFSERQGSVGSMKNYDFYLNPNQPDFINKEIPNKTITVRKVWQDASGNISEALAGIQVTFELYRKEKGSDEYPDTSVYNVTLPKDGKWEYTFTDLDPNYEYEVREVLDSPLYEQTHTVENVSTQKSVWVKASEIQNGHSYLVASKNSEGKVVLLTENATDTDGRFHNNDKVVLDDRGQTITIDGNQFTDTFKYVPDSKLLYTADTGFQFNSGTGTALQSSDREYLRAEKYESANVQSGLMLTTESSLKKDGGSLSLAAGGNIQQDRRFNSELQTYYFDKSTDRFSSSTKTSKDDGNLVYLYEQKTYDSTDQTHSLWTFTNKRKSDYSLNIIKQDGESEIPLSGVQFEMYTNPELTKRVKFSITDGVYQYDQAGGFETLVTDSNGRIVIGGLPINQGTFYLKETQTLDGYVLIDPVEVSISDDADREDGSQDMTISMKIENYKFYELPETGSTGTRFITATGSVLLLTASGLYGYNRKRKRKGGESS